MSADGWNGPRGLTGYDDPSVSPSKTIPIYVLFLIMVGSGILTLVLLWVCVQFVYNRRRGRRARADIESEDDAAQHGPRWEFTQHGPSAPGVKDGDAEAKKCDAGVELTYVVMAGEDQPTFLARPVSSSQDPPSPSQPHTALADDAHDSGAVHSEKAASSPENF